MKTLTIEVTDELHAKIQKNADEFAVTPEDVVKNTLACNFKEKGNSKYLPIITAIVEGASKALQQLIAESVTKDQGN